MLAGPQIRQTISIRVHTLLALSVSWKRNKRGCVVVVIGANKFRTTSNAGTLGQEPGPGGCELAPAQVLFSFRDNLLGLKPIGLAPIGNRPISVKPLEGCRFLVLWNIVSAALSRCRTF